MKQFFFIPFLLIIMMMSCKSIQDGAQVETAQGIDYFTSTDTTPVEIGDEDSEYRLIVFEPGFSGWLATMARPEGFHSQKWLEQRNQVLVNNWNQRFNIPGQYDRELYQMAIDYRNDIDYGYEINYKLYNYFIFFQLKYNQRLSSFNPIP